MSCGQVPISNRTLSGDYRNSRKSITSRGKIDIEAQKMSRKMAVTYSENRAFGSLSNVQ